MADMPNMCRVAAVGGIKRRLRSSWNRGALPYLFMMIIFKTGFKYYRTGVASVLSWVVVGIALVLSIVALMSQEVLAASTTLAQGKRGY